MIGTTAQIRSESDLEDLLPGLNPEPMRSQLGGNASRRKAETLVRASMRYIEAGYRGNRQEELSIQHPAPEQVDELMRGKIRFLYGSVPSPH